LPPDDLGKGIVIAVVDAADRVGRFGFDRALGAALGEE